MTTNYKIVRGVHKSYQLLVILRRRLNICTAGYAAAYGGGYGTLK